jgi:hypothetical protein
MAVFFDAWIAANLRSCWHDGEGNLKPSCTTEHYVSGIPAGARELKSSIVDGAGFLRAGLTTGDSLNRSVKPPN